MAIVTEHSTKINLDLPQGDVKKAKLFCAKGKTLPFCVHARMKVFYNPVMASNRNISILLLNSLPNQEMRIADLLAGSGIRGLRFLQELKKRKMKTLYVNDHKENFKLVFKENLKLNRIKNKSIEIHQEEASLFLLHQEGFDYLDLDPFGSPNPFLAAAMARISRQGILAVTATDTAALTGTYLSATKKKYWSTSLKNYLMHETGLRILIRKVQLQGVQFDKALFPILCYHKDHYFRLYLQSFSSKKLCDEIIRQHQYFLYCSYCLNFQCSKFNKEKCDCGKEFTFAGPLWVGKLLDQKLIAKMALENVFPEEQKFLNSLVEESKKDLVGFYDLHEIAHKYKIEPPKIETILKKLDATRTHFSPHGIKTKKRIKDILRAMKS